MHLKWLDARYYSHTRRLSGCVPNTHFLLIGSQNKTRQFNATLAFDQADYNVIKSWAHACIITRHRDEEIKIDQANYTYSVFSGRPTQAAVRAGAVSGRYSSHPSRRLPPVRIALRCRIQLQNSPRLRLPRNIGHQVRWTVASREAPWKKYLFKWLTVWCIPVVLGVNQSYRDVLLGSRVHPKRERTWMIPGLRAFNGHLTRTLTGTFCLYKLCFFRALMKVNHRKFRR